MSSEAQAGTTAPATGEEPKGSGPVAKADDSGLNAQQQKEWMALKQKAEEFNKLSKEKDELAARLAQAEQMAYSRGAGQATDPTADMIAQLREQAAYDPVAKATLFNMEMAARAQAEAQLLSSVSHISEAKRDRVVGLVRNSNYQMGVEQALSMVTDPETKTYQEQLAEAQKEIERLKNAKPNAASPSTTAPANTVADDTAVSEMKWSEYMATLEKGGDRALALMQQVGSNKVKLVRD